MQHIDEHSKTDAESQLNVSHRTKKQKSNEITKTTSIRCRRRTARRCTSAEILTVSRDSTATNGMCDAACYNERMDVYGLVNCPVSVRQRGASTIQV